MIGHTMGEVVSFAAPGAPFQRVNTPNNAVKTGFDDGEPPVTDTVTHRELDARLEAVEARSDARFAKVDGRFDSIDSTLRDIQKSISGFDQQLKDTKSNVWFAAVTTITVILAVMAYGVQSKDSMRDTLLAAKELAKSVSDAPVAAVPVTSSPVDAKASIEVKAPAETQSKQ